VGRCDLDYVLHHIVPQNLVDQVIKGRFGSDVPDEMAPVAGLFRAARQPGSGSELGGEDEAVAAFSVAVGSSPTTLTTWRFRMLPQLTGRTALIAAAVTLATAGAAAAATGTIPTPFHVSSNSRPSLVDSTSTTVDDNGVDATSSSVDDNGVDATSSSVDDNGVDATGTSVDDNHGRGANSGHGSDDVTGSSVEDNSGRGANSGHGADDATGTSVDDNGGAAGGHGADDATGTSVDNPATSNAATGTTVDDHGGKGKP
jgi:hypothetical protein